MTTPPSAPGPEDVADAARSGRRPSELPGAERADRTSPTRGAPGHGPGAAAAGTTGGSPAEPGPGDAGPGDAGEGDVGVGTTPDRLPLTSPGEGGYAVPPGRTALPDAVAPSGDGPVEAGGARVHTQGATLAAARDTALSALRDDGVAAALAAKDPTLWGAEATTEATARLGWLDLAEHSRDLLRQAAGLREELLADGLDRVVLVGTDGSTLAAEAIARHAGADLVVVDSADPGRTRAALPDLQRSVVVLSSLSEDTAALDAQRRVLEQSLREAGVDASATARRLVAVARPGSALAATAEAEGFRALLLTATDAPASWTALSAPGLVPPTLAGVDCAPLLDAAAALLPVLAADDGPGLLLGAALGGAATSGRDKVVLAPGAGCPEGLTRWVAQLLGSATAGDGRGLVPVVVESADAPGSERQSDTHPVVVGTERAESPDHGTGVTAPLGAQFLLWEHATAVACRHLRADPFDEPDTASGPADAARADTPPPPALVDGPVEVHDESGLLTGEPDLPAALDTLLAAVPLGGHLAVLAHLDPGADAEAARLRPALARRLARSVTFGWGPAGLGAAGLQPRPGPVASTVLVLTGEPEEDLPVPGGGGTLGDLQLAQALADARALARRGHRVLRAHLTDRRAGLARLLAAVTGSAEQAERTERTERTEQAERAGAGDTTRGTAP